MNPIEVQARRNDIERVFAVMGRQIDTLHNELIKLQAECKHPGTLVEAEDFCPDCGCDLVSMNREKVRAKRKELEQRLGGAEEESEIDEIETELRILQNNCPHPKKRRIADGGQSTEYCPDCNWRFPKGLG